MIEKRRFEDISKRYDKKEYNIHDVRDDKKKNKKTEKRVDRIVKKKRKSMLERKNGDILFKYKRLQEIGGKIELRSILSRYQGQERHFKRIRG